MIYFKKLNLSRNHLRSATTDLLRMASFKKENVVVIPAFSMTLIWINVMIQMRPHAANLLTRRNYVNFDKCMQALLLLICNRCR